MTKPKLTHDSLITFGPYNGYTMKQVPVDWLWEFYCETKVWNEDQEQVMDYIKENLEGLKKEDLRFRWNRN